MSLLPPLPPRVQRLLREVALRQSRLGGPPELPARGDPATAEALAAALVWWLERVEPQPRLAWILAPPASVRQLRRDLAAAGLGPHEGVIVWPRGDAAAEDLAGRLPNALLVELGAADADDARSVRVIAGWRARQAIECRLHLQRRGRRWSVVTHEVTSAPEPMLTHPALQRAPQDAVH